jgi:hypothetical protein
MASAFASWLIPLGNYFVQSIFRPAEMFDANQIVLIRTSIARPPAVLAAVIRSMPRKVFAGKVWAPRSAMRPAAIAAGDRGEDRMDYIQ